MSVLLDTHAFLWFMEGNAKLSEPARAAIENTDGQRFLSVSSAWEIAIKASSGKSDEHVFARARSENRIVISGDVDFANTLRFPPGSHVGIVVLRLPNDWSPNARARRALLAIADALPELAEGALVVVDPKRVRLLRPTKA